MKNNLNRLALILQSLTLIISPLYIIRFHIPFNGFTIPSTLLEVSLLLTTLFSFLAFIADGGKLSQIKTKFDLLIALFLTTAILATFQSYDFIGGLGILRAYFIEPILFYYCLSFTTKKYGVSFIINSLLIAGTWLSLLSLLQKVTGQYTLAPYEIAQGRVSAVYNSANALALFLGPLIILSLYKFMNVKENAWLKFSYLFLFLIFLVVLIFTRSRGGLIAEIGSLILMFYTLWVVRSKVAKKIWLIPPLLLVGLTLITLVHFYQNHNFIPAFQGQPYTQGDTLQIRYFIWTGTISMLREQPISGAGLNGFKTLYTNQYRLPQYQEEFQYPHNFLLTFWAETGLSGLFAILLLIVSSYSLIIRNLSKTPNLFLGVALMAAMSYWMLHGMVDVPYFKNDLSLEFWTLIALVQFFGSKNQEAA